MCNYCESNVLERKSLLEINKDIDVYIGLFGKLKIDGYYKDAQINFCPMCGRKLGE